jgi:hypothetical protein
MASTPMLDPQMCDNPHSGIHPTTLRPGEKELPQARSPTQGSECSLTDDWDVPQWQ